MGHSIPPFSREPASGCSCSMSFLSRARGQKVKNTELMLRVILLKQRSRENSVTCENRANNVKCSFEEVDPVFTIAHYLLRKELPFIEDELCTWAL